jgi:hypothetical protein
MRPVEFPFSVLDFGLTALALLVMGVVGYMFVRFARQTVAESIKVLSNLSAEILRHTEVSRSMMEEFYRIVREMRLLREDLSVVERRVTLEETRSDRSELRSDRHELHDRGGD